MRAAAEAAADAGTEAPPDRPKPSENNSPSKATPLDSESEH
ncbi:hypothetical protein ACFUN8_21255 [Streptomyces sp. NPDC057307]